jgi:hypothetical protein
MGMENEPRPTVTLSRDKLGRRTFTRGKSEFISDERAIELRREIAREVARELSEALWELGL